MVISNTTQLAELIDRVWQPQFVNLVARDDFMLRRMPHITGAGDGVRWKVQAKDTNTSAASYSEGDAAPTAVGHKFLDAKLNWKYNWVGIEVTGQMQAQAMGKGGFEGYRDVLATETEQSVLDLKNIINTQLLAASLVSSTDIDGIGIGVKSATSYAGIDPATYTEWASDLGDTGALTIAIMQDNKTTAEDTPRFGNVSVITTTPTLWNAYGNLVQSQRRYMKGERLDGGFQALDFEGVPVVKVPGHTSGRMYFLTEKDKKGQAIFQFVTLQPFKTLDKSAGAADSLKLIVTSYCQLQVRNRRPHSYSASLT